MLFLSFFFLSRCISCLSLRLIWNEPDWTRTAEEKGEVVVSEVVKGETEKSAEKKTAMMAGERIMSE